MNCTLFATDVPISLPDWTGAYHLVVLKKKVLERTTGDITTLYTSASGCPEMTTEMIKNFTAKERKRQTFGEFKKIHYSVYVMKMNSLDSKCSCTCSYFLKKLFYKTLFKNENSAQSSIW